MKILFCGRQFPFSRRRLAELLPEDLVEACTEDRVTDRALDADVLVPLMHRLEPEAIGRTSARLIQQAGVGLEGVDIATASARNIPVCNVPANASANAESTAEFALFLMLGTARRIHECTAAFSDGLWGEPVGEGLFGRKALVVGPGNIGTALIRRLRAMDMEVRAIRNNPEKSIDSELGVSQVGSPSEIRTMVRDADFVILCVPLTPETRGLIDAAVLAKMKPSAYLINVSRGPVVDEEALLEALKSGSIAGAGLDVFVNEPLPPDHPFLSMPNVLATPHVAGVTRQNVEGICRVMAENITAVKNGAIPNYCVNPDAVRS